MSELLRYRPIQVSPGQTRGVPALVRSGHGASCGRRSPARWGYDLYLNGDQSECMFIERYRDSQAAIDHAANLGHLFNSVLSTVSVIHGELLGDPSAELRARLAGSDVPVLFTPYRSL